MATVHGTGGGETYIDCRDLFKIYKRADLEVVALRGLNLGVAQGELIAIVGASGSGKSTLLNILAGLDRPSAGQVRVGARDLLDMSDADLVRYRRDEVGFVWQATALNVAENIELPMALAGRAAGARRSRRLELVETLGLDGKSARMSYELSGGEQQRVAIGVALANGPALLLADEPTGELDTATADQALELLRSLNRSLGVTIVIVTHYPGVSRFVDRVVHIRDGRISSEVYSTPLLELGESTVDDEYLVVDEAGRLQLPQEVAERFRQLGLAKVELEGDRVTIRPRDGRRRPSNVPEPDEGSEAS